MNPSSTYATWNGAFSGNNSMHSINNLLNKGLKIKPTHVVLMHNINDLRVLVYQKDTYWADEKEEKMGDRSLLSRTKSDFTFRNFIKFSLPNISERIRLLKIKIKFFLENNQNVEIAFNEDIEEFIKIGQLIQSNKLDIKDINETYKNQLKAFISISEAYNFKPILMTQAHRINQDLSRLVDKNALKNYGSEYKTFIELYEGINQVTRETILENNITLIDLEKKIPGEKKYIYDLVHFNVFGSMKVGNIIANQLINSKILN